MATKQDVERFLHNFHVKLSVFGIVFRDDRGKNMQTLLELEITPKYREGIIKDLRSEDYVEGPIVDTLNSMGDMWVFEGTSKDMMCISKYQWASRVSPPFVFHFIRQSINLTINSNDYEESIYRRRGCSLS